jgi:hypothetical protein
VVSFHFHPALAGRAGEIGGAGADLDDVGRPAFFHFVDPECALVDQTENHVLAAFPAQREVERAPGGRRDELAIVVVEVSESSSASPRAFRPA